MADYGKDNFDSKGGSKGNFDPGRNDRNYPTGGSDLTGGGGSTYDRSTERLGDTGVTGTAGYTGATSAQATTTSTGSTTYEAQGRSRTGDAEYASAPKRESFGTGTMPAGGYTRPQSIPGLLKELTTGMGSLVRNEMALAKAEMREKASVFTRNAVSVAIGGVIALAGSIILLQAFVGALNSIMDAAEVSPRIYSWLSPLIVALVVLGIGGLLIKKGIDRIKCASLTPERTAQSLRETGEWVKEKVS